MKKLGILIVSLIALTACSQNENQSEESKSDSSFSHSSTVTSETSSDLSTTESETASEEFTFVVDLNDLGFSLDSDGPQEDRTVQFISEGMNVPPAIELLQTANSPDLVLHIMGYEDGMEGPLVEEASFTVQVTEIPTKEIAIFSANSISDEPKRTVEVNTQLDILLTEQTDSSREQISPDQMYLFYNDQGTISLITRNFAGNVGPEDAETMMEYVQGEH